MSTGRCPILRTHSSSPQTMPVAIPVRQGLSPPCFHATIATPSSWTPLAALGSRPHASWLCLVPPPSSTSHTIRLSPRHHPHHVYMPSIDTAIAASGPHAFWWPASLVICAPTLHPQPWHRLQRAPNPHNSGHTLSGGIIRPHCTGPSHCHVTITPALVSPRPRHCPSPTPLSGLATMTCQPTPSKHAGVPYPGSLHAPSPRPRATGTHPTPQTRSLQPPRTCPVPSDSPAPSQHAAAAPDTPHASPTCSGCPHVLPYVQRPLVIHGPLQTRPCPLPARSST